MPPHPSTHWEPVLIKLTQQLSGGFFPFFIFLVYLSRFGAYTSQICGYDWRLKTPNSREWFFFFFWPPHMGSYFSHWGSNLCPLHWKYKVLTTRWPGKSWEWLFSWRMANLQCFVYFYYTAKWFSYTWEWLSLSWEWFLFKGTNNIAIPRWWSIWDHHLFGILGK